MKRALLILTIMTVFAFFPMDRVSASDTSIPSLYKSAEPKSITQNQKIPSSTTSQEPTPTVAPSRTPSPTPSPIVSPTPSPGSEETVNPIPTITPQPVSTSNSGQPQQGGQLPSQDSSNSQSDPSSSQTLQDIPQFDNSLPVTLTINSIPQPYVVDNTTLDSPAPSPIPAQPSKTSLGISVSQPSLTTIIHAPIDFLHAATGKGQYYKSSQLSHSLTQQLLALAAVCIFSGIFLLRPRVIWNRFFSIKYFHLNKGTNPFNFLSSGLYEATNFSKSGDKEEHVIFHRFAS